MKMNVSAKFCKRFYTVLAVKEAENGTRIFVLLQEQMNEMKVTVTVNILK